MYNRLAIFHAAGLLMGINLGPLLAQVAFHRPDLVITALTGAVLERSAAAARCAA
jgi:hypothetical protein